MSGYLLDTNIVSEIARTRSSHVVQIVERLDPAFLSVVTLHELEFGVRRMRDRAARLALEQRISSAIAAFGQNVFTSRQTLRFRRRNSARTVEQKVGHWTCRTPLSQPRPISTT